MQEELLYMKAINKSFSGIPVLKNVDLKVGYGEIHALMGENGAGKSTLIKILTGVYTKDGGDIFFQGRKIQPKSTLDAQNCGISIIYQELNLIPYLSIAENIFLGREKKRRGVIDWKTTGTEAQKALARVGLENIDVWEPLYTQSTAIQQMVAIARAVSIDAKLLVMDEPTSSLDEGEVQSLLDVMRKLKKQGVSIIFIGHRVSEIMEISDRVTILKDGEFVLSADMKNMDKIKLVSSMIGRDANQIYDARKKRKSTEDGGEIVCQLSNIAMGRKIVDVSLKLRRGEVTGLAGLLGSGRTETANVIFGANVPDKGVITISGKQVKLQRPADAIRHNFAYCTEDRKTEGIFANLSIMQNITIANLSHFSKCGVLLKKKQIEESENYVNKIRIKISNLNQAIKNLSGGNQQKVLIARWMCKNPDLIIFDEPTRGIDVGAKFEIESLIQELVERNIAVLMISSEIEELARNCDRIIVLNEGKNVGELTGEQISEETIMSTIAKQRDSMRT